MPHTERNAEIVERYLAGEAITALSLAFGVSRQRIYQIVRYRGAHRPRLKQSVRPGSIQDTKRRRAAGELPNLRLGMRGKTPDALAMREAGASYKAISAALGLSQPGITALLRKWRPDLMASRRK